MPSAYWRPDDPPGRRRSAQLGALELAGGGKLIDATLAYETWGVFTGDNAVLIEHALTGDSHVAGAGAPGHPTAGWWGGLVGPGAAIDTNRWFVLAANVLGGCQGSTGPSSLAPDGYAYGSRFPAVTTRDQVAAEAALADLLGIDRWAAVIGGSMGGQRALEWALLEADRVERLVLLATNAAATAEQIALCDLQILSITSDAAWNGGDYYPDAHPELRASPPAAPQQGLDAARRLAHLSYRSAQELDSRFGRAQHDGGYAVSNYLQHHGGKLTRRFDAGSYVTLSNTMNAHDVGAGRAGVEQALGTVRARTEVIAVDSDRLYRPEQQQFLADCIPNARLHTVHSRHGHDGFLIETEQVGSLIATTFDH